MSMTTSRPNVCRYSTASLDTQTAASGSSPFTWKIGAWIILATSVQYSLDRDASGAVVNPTWLLMITCRVPPVRYPRSWDSCRVSATTPCSARLSWSCLALATPASTGSTTSRCDGFATRVTSSDPVPEGGTYLPSAPRWYFTSPEP